MEERKKFFNQLAEHWDHETQPDRKKLLRVIREARLTKNQVVLDVGSGTGVLIPAILEVIGPRGMVYALDYAERMIRQIRSKNFPANVIPFLGDIHQTSFPDAFFDRIIANACYPHFDDKKKALCEMLRIVKPGGILVISHPTGRTRVNRHHRRIHPAVRMDILPPARQLQKLLDSIGFSPLRTIEEPQFYLVAATR